MYVIDVSSNNPLNVPWGQFRDHNGIHGGIVKATEGNSYQNPNFGRQWRVLDQLGMEKAGYLWAHPGVPAGETIRYYLNYVHRFGGHKPGECIWVDFEQNDGFDRAKCDAWLVAAEAELDALAAQQYAGVYASNSFLEWLGVRTSPWDQYLVWVASYGSQPTITNWYGHQYTDSFAGQYDCSLFPRGMNVLPIPPPHPDPHMTPARWLVLRNFIHTHEPPASWGHLWTYFTSNPEKAYELLVRQHLV